MPSERAVKVAVTLLSILIAVVPVVYGLNEFGWDFREAFRINYEPPRIEFRFRFTGFKVTSPGEAEIRLAVSNQGEVPITIKGLDGELRLGAREVGSFKLIKPAKVSPGEEEEIIVSVSYDVKALAEAPGNAVTFSGSLLVEVMGADVESKLSYELPTPYLTGEWQG